MFYDQFDSFDIINELAPEELAGRMLAFIREANEGRFHLQDFAVPQQREELHNQRAAIETIMAEAWAWLEVQGLIIAEPGYNGNNGFKIITRRGRTLVLGVEFQTFRNSLLLPKENLHPRMRDEVWSAFVRAQFSVAVFLSMRAVETFVREVAGYGPDMHGVNLLRAAWHDEQGPLTDDNLEPAEKQAVSALFSGAYGYFRNPAAHRDVDIDTAEQAVEIILFANHLMRMTEAAHLRLQADE